MCLFCISFAAALIAITMFGLFREARIRRALQRWLVDIIARNRRRKDRHGNDRRTSNPHRRRTILRDDRMR